MLLLMRPCLVSNCNKTIDVANEEISKTQRWLADFAVLISLRISSALWSPISDCDEVYNYWEPLHLLIYKSGFQTWEYSPNYAIRSYFYVWLHRCVVYPFQSILPHTKVTTFFFVRCFLASLTAAADICLYTAVRDRLGNAVARYQIAFSAVSAGMFIASSAFLPSSFSMTLSTFAVAAYFKQKFFLSVLCTAISALVGWPFAAVLGLPIVAHLTLEHPRRVLSLLLYALAAGVPISGLLLAFDSYLYGRWVLAPLNIVLYNVMGAGGGPNLYGTEPASYYVLNLLLNWNVAFPLALVALPAAAIAFRFTTVGFDASLLCNFSPVLYVYISLFTWLAIFFSQPHKEERFLFPIYPLLALSAGLTLDAAERIWTHIVSLIKPNSRWHFVTHLREAMYVMSGVVLAVFMLFALSRSAAVYRYYHAPVDIYMHANERVTQRIRESTAASAAAMSTGLGQKDNLAPPSQLSICVGKEWHRFPSSFFLPPPEQLNGTQVSLKFVKSAFRGLLPKPFLETHTSVDSKTSQFLCADILAATRFIPTTMNDMNREELDRYVADVSTECDYFVDLERPPPHDALEPNYADDSTRWQRLHSVRFLLADHSPRWSRAFFLPVLSEKHARFAYYSLLERIR